MAGRATAYCPKYLEVVDQAHSLGFEIVSYQILGLPFETSGEMIGTMALMVSLPVLIGTSFFTSRRALP